MFKWYWIISLIATYKLISNIIKLVQCDRLQSNYLDFLDVDSDFSPYQDSREVNRLILGAGVPDKKIPVVQPAGFGLVHSVATSVLGQYPSKDERFVRATVIMFEQAIGEYKHRCIETLNPLYWIDFVIWLPKRFFSYLGVSDSNFATKIIHCIFQGLYWLASITFLTYDKEFKLLLVAIIERMKSALLG